MEQMIYFFKKGEGKEGLDKLNILGNKGARLADMASLGIPVPPGFTISTEVCNYYNSNCGKFPPALKENVLSNLTRLEEVMDQKFGCVENPLLLSARSGAVVSMPGMMDTILNLGLNREIVQGLAKKTGDPRFAWDCYRRLLQMFGSTVEELDDELFDNVIKEFRLNKNVESETQFSEEDVKTIAGRFEEVYKENGKVFPYDPFEQLFKAIEAVLRSSNSSRAVAYCKAKKISGSLIGTAVTIQAMVFGNMGGESATGVVFSRNITNGEKGLYGEYLMNSQGEDVVAGIRTPCKIEELKNEMSAEFSELEGVLAKFEERYKDVQDVEFTIEEGRLFILQSRNAKRTPVAMVKILVDMVEEGLLTKEEALSKVNMEQLNQLTTTKFEPKAKRQVICSGLSVTPGVAVGKVVFRPKDAIDWSRKGESVILVRDKTSPADFPGMEVAEGILTSVGGASSHAAIVCRDLGKNGIVGCKQITVECANKQFRTNEVTVSQGDWLSLDGDTGEVILGKLPVIKLYNNGNLKKLLGWVREFPSIQQKFNKILQKVNELGDEQ